MSLKQIQQAIADKKMICPKCKKAVGQYEKFQELTGSIWDGAGDSNMETAGSKVTLICSNCDWKERTEYWANYIED
jgi:RNase P subunit RPR2